MQPWLIWLNVIGMLALVIMLYILNKRVTSRFILLAPIVVYVIISLEDLFGWIDIASLLESEGALRALIVLFVLGSVILYILYIFRKIADTANNEIGLKAVVIRISTATLSCILFFTIVYTSIYKLFKGGSFMGENIGSDTLSQLITFLYFSAATFTTVGYGDIRPVDNTSRLVVVLELFFSFVTVAYALSMLGVFRQIFKDMPGANGNRKAREEAIKDE
ncbi:potassium channel family protein [Paenibacillus lentus]|uniref:potassium channel family protein n=1 Tax=Paenibacillus lentus TaxID=1338368 RepID=UPI003667E38E